MKSASGLACVKDVNKDGRLLSLDVLRGFDMLFIIGGTTLVLDVIAAFGWRVEWVEVQLHHAAWHGLHFYDTIFPLFLFLAGVSWPFSLAKQRERGLLTSAIVRKIIRRGAVLSLLGFAYNGLLKLDFGNMIWGAVLTRIGIAWMIAALLSVFVRTCKLILLSIIILLAYWGVCVFVAAPDAPGLDPLSMRGCFAGWVDRVLMPGKLTHEGVISNQGILATVPAVVTALLGVFSGKLLRRVDVCGLKKSVFLGIGAVVLLALGFLMAYGFGCYSMPFNKVLWSSSFTLAVGGYSMGLLALFYWLIDVKGFRRWTLLFQVIGMNSITVYLAIRIMGFSSFADFFFGGMANMLPPVWGRVLLSGATLWFAWAFLYFLYRKKLFLRV